MVKDKHVVGFLATVKVTILNTGASHEDVGCGEGCHKSKIKAIDNAIKSAVTDAMKRAARHFGERLGNGTLKGNMHFAVVVGFDSNLILFICFSCM